MCSRQTLPFAIIFLDDISMLKSVQPILNSSMDPVNINEYVIERSIAGPLTYHARICKRQ